MNLRVAGDSDAEEVSIFLLDVPNEIDSMVESILYGLPISLASGWIAL